MKYLYSYVHNRFNLFYPMNRSYYSKFYDYRKLKFEHCKNKIKRNKIKKKLLVIGIKFHMKLTIFK